ncbi:MAG: hypothetical protein Q9191_002743, partial [Dirinaria sp. TL-2023a]
PVLYELRKTHELHLTFIDGPNLAPAMVGVAEQYEGPYYRFYGDDAPQLTGLAGGLDSARSEEKLSPEEFMRKLGQHGLLDFSAAPACDFVEELAVQEEEDIFDGILGFSEGASVAASLLLRHAAQNLKSRFKFAVFLCGTPPQRCQDRGVILADESPARITIPTAHIVGSRDPGYRASLALYNLCDRQSAEIYDHGRSHAIPWDPSTTRAMAREIRQAIQRSLECSHPHLDYDLTLRTLRITLLQNFATRRIIMPMTFTQNLNGMHGPDSEQDAKDPTSSPSQAATMPIAVVGLAGRFPGDATTPQALWEMCCNSKSAWSEIRKDRMNAAAYFHPNPSKSGCAMDPQQRLLLEVTYEALENAGVPLDDIAGTSTGVYVGAAQIDYTNLLSKDVEDLPVYQSTGTSANILSNRISYVFDLKGPSITMDTACSSSLAALHTACQSLRSGEISQAVVCGAHIMLSPDTMVGMSMLRLFGEQGRSYTFDSRGTGYGRGEGIVSFLIKPLDAAIQNSDNIRAVIRNTGINQDGKTHGITFPSCEAQASLMECTYRAVGLDPAATDYVEAHGTGTAAGDPVEAEAISRIFTNGRDEPLFVGSIKTNVGHLEAASGLTGMVKVIYALENGIIPPNINFEAPNPAIPLATWKLKVPFSTSLFSLGLPDSGTNAHVILEQYIGKQTSNGYPHTKGIDDHHTNGVWTKAKSVATSESFEQNSASSRYLFVFSAGDKISLKCYMDRLASYLSEAKASDDAMFLEQLAFTLGHRRSTLDWREAVAASTSTELREALASSSGNFTRSFNKPSLGFVFTGQGSQWHAMGRELFSYEIFAKSMQESDAYLKDFGADWSLLVELGKDAESSLVNQPVISQPATTAVQIALVCLLCSWGIKPSSVAGHSSGEIAAAYAAGALSARACLLISYQRGALAETLSKGQTGRSGRMLAIGASSAKVRPMLERLGSAQVVIACVNGPSLITASGDERGISRLQNITEQENHFSRQLKVDVAYHSHHMQDISSEYLASLKSVEPQLAQNVEFHSSVHGRQIDTKSLDAAYWVENMTSPVQFLDAVQSMYTERQGPDALIEIGPHCTLESPIRDIMRSNSHWASRVRYFSSLTRGQNASLTMLSLASALFVLGCRLDLKAINHANLEPPPLLRDLPTYPWNHSKRHWHESRLSANHRRRAFPRSDLLGSLVDDYNHVEPRWRNILRISDVPWLADHQVQGSTIFPLTGYLAMAIEAAYQHALLHEISVTSASQYKLRQVKIGRSMVLVHDSATEVSLILRPHREGSRSVSNTWNEFQIFSWTHEGGWAEHCHGFISLTHGDFEPNPINGARQVEDDKGYYKDTVDSFNSSCTKTLTTSDIYSRFSRRGLEFGPAFRNISAAYAANGLSIGIIIIPDTAVMMPNNHESMHIIHPGTFDACFQVVDFAAAGGDLSRSDIHVPTFVKEVTICHALPTSPRFQLASYAQASPIVNTTNPDIHASFFVLDREFNSDPLIKVDGLVVTKLPDQNVDIAHSGERELCYMLNWEPYLDLLSAKNFRTIFDGPINQKGSTPQIDKLERAAFAHIELTIADIIPQEATRFSPHLQQLFRVLSAVVEEGHRRCLPFQNFYWLESGAAEKTKFLQEVESSDDCGRLVCNMGRNLSYIFRQEVEPLTIMLEDNMLKNYYRQHDMVNWGYERTASILGKLAHQNPNMRIIELGAGTGGATMPMLRQMGHRFAHFDFTDVSTGFFESAEVEQAEWAERISYRKLDIEQDPISQGFQSESYDLVVATNVLHATANMANTIGNVRRLLKPGGKALIAEITGQLLSNMIIFGTLPGWWLGEEPERRDGPFLKESHWDGVLHENGFTGVDGSVQINGDGHSIASVMLATAKSDQKPSCPDLSLVQTFSRKEDPLTDTLCMNLSDRATRVVSVGQLLEADLNDKYAIVLEMEDAFWFEIDGTALERMQSIFQLARGILWVTRGASTQQPLANMVAGLARSIRSENAGLRFATIDFDAKVRLSDDDTAELILQAASHVFNLKRSGLAADMEFKETNGVFYIPRILKDKRKDEYVVRETRPPLPQPEYLVQEGRPLKLKLGQIGLLDSIFFVADETLQLPLLNDEVEISVKATGINFKDVMISLGQIPYYHDLGLECSGVISRIGSDVYDFRVGDRVCGMAKGAYASSVRVKNSMMTGMPSDMTFSEAASFPVVFCTARYALLEMGRLREGDKVLIHAAAGGVGQAAIMLAQNAKAEIYATTLPMSELGQGESTGQYNADDETESIQQAMPAPLPKVSVSPHASYLITGGTGGLGRSITRWLAGQGAKHIVLASRSGLQQSGITELIDEVKCLGAHVVVKACDIADRSQVQSLVDECHQTMPPIRGVIHGAMALRDALFDRISHEDWTLNIAPRVNGALNLHHSFLTSPLDFFVVLASGSGVLGNPGQTAYAASNSFLDSFAAYRQSLGLAACTIDIGIVENVGYVAENIDRRTEIGLAAHDSLSECELHALIKAAIDNPHNPIYQQTLTGFKLSPEKPLPVWGSDPKFSHVLHDVQSMSACTETSTEGVVPVRQRLKAASSVASATEIIVGLLIKKLANLLMITEDDVDSKKPIVAYGLDSLVAVEFRNWITCDLDAKVPLMVLMNSPSIDHLGGKIAAESTLIDKNLVQDGVEGGKNG